MAVGIATDKESLAKDLLSRVKLSYESLPIWLKQTVVSYNLTEIEFGNGSKVTAAATTKNTFRRKTFIPTSAGMSSPTSNRVLLMIFMLPYIQQFLLVKKPNLLFHLLQMG